MNGLSIRNRKITGVVVLLAAIVCTAAYPRARKAAYDTLIGMSGALVPDGSGNMEFVGHPVRVVSVHGRQWDGENRYGKEEGVYHLVVLFPSGEITGLGSANEVGEYSAATRDRWEVLSGSMIRDVRVESSYNPMFRRVLVNGEAFSLTRGNVFVVRVGDRARLHVTQVGAAVQQPNDWRAIEAAVQARIPNDHEVQRVFRGLHGRPGNVPCPEKGYGEAAPARTSSA